VKRIAIRIAINAVALAAAASIVGGITLEGGFWSVLMVAAIFGLVNAVIKPIVILFALPALILTIGVALVAINALMLVITDAFTTALDVDGFGSALFGALVISAVSWAVGRMLSNEKRHHAHYDSARIQT